MSRASSSRPPQKHVIHWNWWIRNETRNKNGMTYGPDGIMDIAYIDEGWGLCWMYVRVLYDVWIFL